MRVILVIVFMLFGTGLFLLLSGILRLPTLRTSKVMMDTSREDKKLSKTLDALYMDGAAKLAGFIRLNDYKRSRLDNVLRASGFGMTPEVYMAYACLKAGSIFMLVIPALYTTIMDFIRYACAYFLTTQQYFEWRYTPDE